MSSLFSGAAKAAAALALLAVGAASHAVTFYVVAHEDDWQLFMGEGAFYDVTAGGPTVFIYLTAGDAGLKAGGTGKISYYRAREEAAKSSLRVATSNVEGTFSADEWGKTTINGKSIQRHKHRNTTSYFLRLPDGNYDGLGFSGTSFRSLAKLYKGQIASLSAVDNSATYTGWSSLTQTLRSIYSIHTAGQTSTWINTHDPDLSANIGSHSDHTTAAMAAIQAGQGLGASYAYWLDYVLRSYPSSLSVHDTVIKAGYMGAIAASLDSNGYPSTFEPGHLAFCDKSRLRVELGQ